MGRQSAAEMAQHLQKQSAALFFETFRLKVDACCIYHKTIGGKV